MHYHLIEDSRGDVIDAIAFCCDSCHQEWCEKNGAVYGGWNGCQEGSDYPAWCANCGTFAGGESECECQRDNPVVNRFVSDTGERCEHGHWLQLPERYLNSAEG